MAKGIVINTVGRDLERYRKDTIKKVRNLISDFASQLEIDATRSAPNFIHIDKKFSKGGLSADVGVMGDNPLAAYIEFGTGLSAVEILAPYPQWIKDVAMEFYINGMGTLKGEPYLYNNYLRLMHSFRVELDAILKIKRES